MQNRENSLKSKISIFLLSIGPGLFLVGYNIGTGSITTMATAGADHGMSLTWTILLACIFTYVLVVTFGRFTIITGETSLQSFKKYFGKTISAFVMLTLIFTEMVSSIGVMAVMTEAVSEWSKPLTPSGEGFSTIILAALFAAASLFFLFNGKYSYVEKILGIFVALMGISFFLTAFMVIPDASAVIEGLVPQIPEGTNTGILVAGMLGTTMGGVLYVTRSITVKQKEWKIDDLKIERRDALISSSLMFILSIAVMAAAAGTLHPLGLKIDNAIDMIKTLEPLAGRFAISVFVTGIVCAGLSSLFPHYILIPLLLSDYNDENFDLTKPRNKALMIFYASLGLIVPIFGGRPVFIMIISQAFTLIITPLILILLLILLNRKDLMGKYKATPVLNAIFILITLFTIYMAVIGIIGIADL